MDYSYEWLFIQINRRTPTIEPFARRVWCSRKRKKLAQFNYEKGVRTPDASYLQAIAEHGVDVCYLLTGKRTENEKNIESELEYLADAWEAIDYALDQASKYLPSTKKRQAAKALYLAFKEGEIQDFKRGANLLLAAA